MLKRHFISTLIVVRHRATFFALFLIIVGSQHVSAQSQLAQDAYAIFEQKCLTCHGPDGAYRDVLLMEHDELIEGGTVIRGNPDASDLYNRLLGPTEDGGLQMPLGTEPLPAQSIDIIRRWILAGAPDWAATPITDSPFIPLDEILNTIESHLMSLAPFDRAFARYLTLTHLYNAGERVEILREYRKALSKLINSLSWGLEVTNPKPIDPQQTIFYIDLRHYEWDVDDGWTKIENVYPYHISFDAPAQTALREQLERLQTEMNCVIPSVHIDWFLATASSPPLYHDLLSLPLTDSELETRLEVNVDRNLNNAPGVRVWRAGFNNSGVSNNNRVVERHASRYGAYWKSYDFAGSIGTQNIFTHPLDFTRDGGEMIFNLPNGLQGYLIVDDSGHRLDEAPINIVSNPAASDPTVRNGLSCIGCHIEGMNKFEDQVRSAIESHGNPPYDKAQALRLYVQKSDMDARVEEDINRYRAALEATGGLFGGVEPISRFHEAFQGPVAAAYAAAVVGLETETFLQKVRENLELQNVGLLALDGENGSVKRDAWTSSFRDVMYALDYPQQVGELPDETTPDVLPGLYVHIPDPNLRAVIAEKLGKSTNAPITVEEMEGLTYLGFKHRGVLDLTGLQHATNLTRIYGPHNQISDLSPLRGLTNLTHLDVGDNQVSDLSQVAGLIDLEFLSIWGNNISDLSPLADLNELHELWARGNQVSDLSPVKRLTNLTHLEVSGNQVSDISPLTRLTELNHLNLAVNGDISDISPLAGLTNLKWLAVDDNQISELSPLAGLTELNHLNLAVNGDISDISPLAGLTELNHLNLAVNGDISDISPLAGLTNLKWLAVDDNQISELSPLAGLTELNHLNLAVNDISDISPLAGLTNLEWLSVSQNDISDVAPLAGLTNLKWLGVYVNKISDISPLDGLRENTTVVWHSNPVFPTDAPKIEGPWLWVTIPDTRLLSGTDSLAEASGGRVTEVEIATHGATAGKSVGDGVWTSRRLPPTEWNNVEQMLGGRIDGAIVYGTVSFYSPRQQDTTMYVGSHNSFKVLLNGDLIYESLGYHASFDYTDILPVTLQQGKNVLLVAIEANYNSFFGFEPGTEYTVATGIGYAFSETPIYLGDTFTFDVRAENVSDLSGWQFDIAYDPALLEAVDVSEGDFLKTDGGATFFQDGRIDNTAGKITGLNAALFSERGVDGSGIILQVTFKTKSNGETALRLQNFKFGSSTGEIIPAAPLEVYITVEERLLSGDVNRDGDVDILDLILVARQFGQSVSPNSNVDVNGDGEVDIFDLTIVARRIGDTTNAAAPAIGTDSVDAATIEAWIAQARLADDGSIVFRQGIKNLEALLATLIPQETSLQPNYPNPFNPETWIPYQLATPAEVVLTIYDMNGGVVRRLVVGHQAPGMYQSRSRAVYWDGRNQRGESVASGLYFYTLRANNFTATRKMLIRK